ncbi:MAG: hypothetical protein K1X57_09565 [Gemmataceae bacterium]|nr:hypothetical protein [Gemmataceae bacterium]
MPVQEKDQECGTLVQKMTAGDHLTTAEKSHLAGCEGCMLEVVRALDESAMNDWHGTGHEPAGGNGDLPQARTEARNALEQGLKLFEREFGISLAKK